MGGVVAAVAGPLIGGLMGGDSGGGSTGRQATQLADPFNASRGYYGGQLNQYMKDPTAFTKASPGYQFNYEQGLDALQRQFAAGGMSASGNALIGAEQYGQNYAMQQGNNVFNQLAQLSGANWNSGPNAASAMLGATNMQSQYANQIGQGISGAMNKGGLGGFIQSMFNGAPTGMSNADLAQVNQGWSDPSIGWN